MPLTVLRRSYPLILINHGLGTSSLLLTSLTKNQETNSYNVAAVVHTYSITATLFSEGTVTRF